MAEAPKSRVMILAVMAAVFFATTAALYVFLNAERSKRETAEKKLNEVTIEKENVERDLEETIKVKVNLETQLKDTETKLEGISKELADEKQAKEVLEAEIETVKKDTLSLRSQLDSEKRSRLVLTTEKSKLSDDLTKVKKDYDSLKMQLEQVKRVKDALEAKVSDMLSKQQAQLEKIVVTPKDIEGKVMVVNKDFGFIVINLGEKDGIRVGTVFEVLRDNKQIGKVQVDKVYPSMSGATILPETKVRLKENDVVKPI